jgi:hypothetical protein
MAVALANGKSQVMNIEVQIRLEELHKTMPREDASRIEIQIVAEEIRSVLMHQNSMSCLR